MAIEIDATTVVPRPAEEVFDAMLDVAALPRFFTGVPPFVPAVREAFVEGGGAVATGARRVLRLADGSTVIERVLACDRPTLHRYDIAEMNALQRSLCTEMVSEWRFTDIGCATRVHWRYTLHPRGRALAPVAWLAAKLLRRAMQRCLDHLAAALR